MTELPPLVLANRREICDRCPTKCAAYDAGKVEFENPRQRCPKSKWGCYGPCKDPELPSARQVASNATHAAARLVTGLVRHQPVKVSEAEAARRKEICAGCPFFRVRDERCAKCGCYTARKAYLKTEKCPVGKW